MAVPWNQILVMLWIHNPTNSQEQMHSNIDIYLLEILLINSLVLKIFLQKDEEGRSIKSIKEFIHLFYPLHVGQCIFIWKIFLVSSWSRLFLILLILAHYIIIPFRNKYWSHLLKELNLLREYINTLLSNLLQLAWVNRIHFGYTL